MADDWFRSPDWSPDAQADFEARLQRARPHNRTQYLRMKGLALRESGQLDAARGLWSRILEDDLGHDFEQASTIEHLADSFVGEDPTTAERHYQSLLIEHPTLNGTTATAEISLAELLIDRADPADIEEALAHLNSFLERDTAQFPSVLFRWHLALIRIAQATGDEETVRRSALDRARPGRARPGLPSSPDGRRRALGRPHLGAAAQARDVAVVTTGPDAPAGAPVAG